MGRWLAAVGGDGGKVDEGICILMSAETARAKEGRLLLDLVRSGLVVCFGFRP